MGVIKTEIGDLTDEEILNLLLGTYLTEAERVIKTHDCGGEGCNLVELSEKIVSDIKKYI